MIMPDYYKELYAELQEYFNAIRTLHDGSGKLLDTILDSNQSPRIIKLYEYTIENEKMRYSIRRIGRLKSSYTLFLYKMFLEYRGRHPFNTINMSRLQEGSVEIEEHENKKINVTYFLSPERNINRNDSRKLIWIIKIEDINSAIKEILNENVKIVNEGENIYLDKLSAPYDKVFTLDNEKKLTIIKRKGKINLKVE